jgi:hypothetical protein
MRTQFPQAPVLIWLLAALAAVIAIPLVALIVTLLIGISPEVTVPGTGELPAWLPLWGVALLLFFALLAVLIVWVFVVWFARESRRGTIVRGD